jgi:hypothetical protein
MHDAAQKMGGPMRFAFTISTALIALAVTSCTPPAPEKSRDSFMSVVGSGPPLLAAWTQFVAQPTGLSTPYKPAAPYAVQPPIIELRFVTASTSGDGTNCAKFWVSYTDSAGKVAAAQSFAYRANPDPANFAIDVCTLTLKADWTEVRIIAAKGDINGPGLDIVSAYNSKPKEARLPGPRMLGRRNTSTASLNMMTIGDTGCTDTGGQDCSKEWPFGQLTEQAAKGPPTLDLVLHTGDYRYYGGHGSAGTKSWDYWLRELLAPARNLLVAAPWAFSRGNHEQCDSSSNGSAGPGFFFLLGSNSSADVKNCLDDGSPAWFFDVAPGGVDPSNPALAHRFVMIDSSYHFSAKLQGQFDAAIQYSNLDSVWWVTHTPPIDLLHFGGKTQQGDSGVKGALTQALSQSNNATFKFCDSTRGGKPTCSPSTLLVSHDHLFQTVTFEQNGKPIFPQTYVVGNGGVKLRDAGIKASPCSFAFSLPDRQTSTAGIVETRLQHGYIVWTRDANSLASQNGWLPTRVPNTAAAPHGASAGQCQFK